MSFLTHKPAPFNRVSATNRLPSPDPFTLDYARRHIERRYNVSPGMARIVAELVNASIVEARQ
jgi:hypothetical protein